jgi:hypothetical protein
MSLTSRYQSYSCSSSLCAPDFFLSFFPHYSLLIFVSLRQERSGGIIRYLGHQSGVSSCRDRSRCQSGRLDFLTLTLIFISFFHFHLFLFSFSFPFSPCHDEVPASGVPSWRGDQPRCHVLPCAFILVDFLFYFYPFFVSFPRSLR